MTNGKYWWTVAVVTPALLTAACSESSRRGDGGGGSAAWETYCETTGPERAAACGETWDETDTADCLAFSSCAEGLIRSDLFARVPECLADRSCGGGDDACYSAEGLGGSSSAAAASYRDDCLAKREACVAAEEGFSDDLCYAGIVSDDVVADIRTCLDEPCTGVRECFDAVVPACD